MDTALFYPAYLNLSVAEARETVDKVVDYVARLGGVLTVNWHDRSIAPERFWNDFYEPFLNDLKARKAWFPTAGQAVAWFRRRRGTSLEVRSAGPGRIHVNALVPQGDMPLPGMRVRVHKRGETSFEDLFQRRPEGAFADVALCESREVALEG